MIDCNAYISDADLLRIFNSEIDAKLLTAPGYRELVSNLRTLANYAIAMAFATTGSQSSQPVVEALDRLRNTVRALTLPTTAAQPIVLLSGDIEPSELARARQSLLSGGYIVIVAAADQVHVVTPTESALPPDAPADFPLPTSSVVYSPAPMLTPTKELAPIGG